MAGGWEQAARLPILDALALADQHLKRETREALRHALLCWHSALPLYAQGGTPPDPPTLEEEDEDE